jgi:hypothetical protein
MRTEWDGELYEQQRRVFGETLRPWTCVAFCRACAPYAFTRHLTSRFQRGSAAPLQKTTAIHRHERHGRHFPLPMGLWRDGALSCV